VQPFSGLNTDDDRDGRPKDSSPVTISLHETLLAFLEDIFITRKLNNPTNGKDKNAVHY
jgi:hypothetical protein